MESAIYLVTRTKYLRNKCGEVKNSCVPSLIEQACAWVSNKCPEVLFRQQPSATLTAGSVDHVTKTQTNCVIDIFWSLECSIVTSVRQWSIPETSGLDRDSHLWFDNMLLWNFIKRASCFLWTCSDSEDSVDWSSDHLSQLKPTPQKHREVVTVTSSW